MPKIEGLRPESQALVDQIEAASAQESDEFEVYTEGLIYCSVCSSLPFEEVKAKMASRPSGTRLGWAFSDNPTFSGGQPNPSPCNERPATHKHYLFNC